MSDDELFSEIVSGLVIQSDWQDYDELRIGDNISTISEVKVIFDGYGDLEYEDENGEYQYEEGGNESMLSFAVFLHRDALEGKEFPEHDFTPWGLIHRPKDEICVFVWYDAENDEYDVQYLYDILGPDKELTEDEIMEIIQYIAKKYFEGVFDE